MHRAESVVDVDVAQLAERADEGLVVGLLTGVKAQVLQEHHLRGAVPARRRHAKIVNDLLGRIPDAILGQVHLVAGELGEASPDRLEAELVVALTLWPAEVRGEDHLRPGLDAVFDGGEGGLDPRVVRDLAALLVERRVEVDPDEDPLVGQPVALFEGAELQVLDRRDVVEDSQGSAPFLSMP